MVCWMTDVTRLQPRSKLIIKHTTRTARALVRGLQYRLDVNTLHRDESATSLVETLESTEDPPDEQYARMVASRQLAERLSGALEVLDKRERLIVEQRILGDEEVSLAALGRELGVSRERARQLEARAKAKLRNELRDLAPAA